MIRIDNVLAPSEEMIQTVIRGMRNPYNSWDKSDHGGEKDHELMRKLADAGNTNPSHSKFRRMMIIYVDITAPFYWWKEYDTYKIGTVANSCSTMHSIISKPFVEEDFSFENVPDDMAKRCLDDLNFLRDEYIVSTDPIEKRNIWYRIIKLLPESYMQKRTVMVNYEVLHKIYIDRKDHKLYEWHTFCDWIKSLPNSNLIV